MMEQEVLGLKSPALRPQDRPVESRSLIIRFGRVIQEGQVVRGSIVSFRGRRRGSRLLALNLTGASTSGKTSIFASSRKGRPLYEEVEFILREELREPRYYFALLQAMAQGKRKLSEIVNATGILSRPPISILASWGI